MELPSTRVIELMAIIMLSFLTFNSCKKDHNIKSLGGQIFENTQMTQATFLGQVFQEDGSPLADAKVSTGGYVSLTDNNGFFLFKEINTPKNATLIKVSKPGYFDGYRTIKVISNEDNHVEIILMELPQARKFESALGGLIPIEGGGAVVFPAKAIMELNTKKVYNGTVNVFAKWINPEDARLNELMPGALRAIDANNFERGLVTFGMHNVEMYGDQGQELQLIEGEKASLHFPISPNLIGAAKQIIPLWYFDEVKGMWIQEGFAEKIGNEYIGDVGHFTPWNVDLPMPVIDFECVMIDKNGTVLSNVAVGVKTQEYGSFFLGYTNTNGKILGRIPFNVNCDLFHFQKDCGTGGNYHIVRSFFSSSGNLNLGKVIFKDTVLFTTVAGAVVGCNNQFVANAPVKIRLPKNYYGLTDSAGRFFFTIPCNFGNWASLGTAYNSNNNEYGYNGFNYFPDYISTTGVLSNCGNTANNNDFISLVISKSPNEKPRIFHITNTNGIMDQKFENNMTVITCNSNSQFIEGKPLIMEFGFAGPRSMGPHTLMYYKDSKDSIQNPQTYNFHNDYYDGVGQKISGSFVIKSINSSPVVSCKYRVTRKQ